MISGFNTQKEIEQLRIAIEFHQGQIERIERRIEELQEESQKDELCNRDLFNPNDDYRRSAGDER